MKTDDYANTKEDKAKSSVTWNPIVRLTEKTVFKVCIYLISEEICFENTLSFPTFSPRNKRGYLKIFSSNPDHN